MALNYWADVNRFWRPAFIWFFLLFSVNLCLSAAAFAAGSSTSPAIAFAAKIVGDDSRARIIVDFDRKIKHESYLFDQPKRLIIDLPETLFNLEDDARVRSSSLISELRVGTVAQGQSRIVLSLSGPAIVEKQSFKKVSNGDRYRLIVDVVRTKPETFAAALRQDGDKTATITAKKPSNIRYKIVLDPGHGGIDGGAIGRGGTSEKNVTLGFALKLREELEKNPMFQVVMTRDGDQFVKLKDRVAIARQNNADLLISVHADSLRQKYIRGATVYTLSEKGSDEISRLLARKQNRSDLVAGLNLPDVETKVTDILIDLTRRETAVFSSRFANLLIVSLKNDLHLIRNPHRSADFFVLKAPEIPSVLLELGYLSNLEDEKLMRSAKWQNRAVMRTKTAIEEFFSRRMQQ